MPRYYCDYCDTYLTHDSPSVRKQHNAGYKHKANVRTYYQQYEAQLNQSLIDQKVKEHLGQAAAFPPIGAPYGPRPRLPVLPTPIMPIPGQVPTNSPSIPGIRLPVFPRPISGTPGYAGGPAMPSMVAPPGAPSLPGQLSGPPRHVTVSAPTMVPGSTMALSGGPPSLFVPTLYQPSTATPTTVGSEGSNVPAQAPDANH